MRNAKESGDTNRRRRGAFFLISPRNLLQLSKTKLLMSIAALLAVGSLAVAGTWAAWTAQDVNGGNTFTTSTILIDDNQGGEAGSATATGTAMFNVTNLSPGSAATTKCIEVDYTGTATGMTLSGTLGGAGQAALQSQLTMNTAVYNSTAGAAVTTPGTNTNNGACTSYPGGTDNNMGTQGATLATWANGTNYTASTMNHTWYKFTVSGLPGADTNCATYCNQTITVTLTWTLTAT
ncbi:SipW-cognate class signal peptide [Frankineae bacterium MT45]|nr:SipW-cognate class signal peptide [Frankineae bacterium MT45]